ncbi:MAG: NUDIX hydrolase [Candidatus Omnitrophica bacterium]|nr:NUDIX hydrolase [Candidatus Omnitrophota bacterium]
MKKKVLYQGKYLRLVSKKTWEFVERIHGRGVVVIVPLTPQKTVIMIDQYRTALDKRVVEFPAGIADDLKTHRGESLENAARRELTEETGYQAGKMKRLTSGPSASGASSAIMTFFLAQDLIKVSDGGGDDTEDIHVHEIPLKKVPAWIKKMEKKGMLVDPKVYAGLYFLEKL